MRLSMAAATVMVALMPIARASDAAHVLVASAQQHLESTDSRATGRLVRVGADGKRTNRKIAIKAHWFPGVFRVLLEIDGAVGPDSTTGTGQTGEASTAPDTRESVLLEMRPEGQSTVLLFHPKTQTPTNLPFSRWAEGVAGSDFSYEDFLQPELFWKQQSLVQNETIGGTVCDGLRSAPGAADRSHYAQVITCFDHATGYPLRVEKTLKSAATVKDFTSLGLTQSGGVWAARQVQVKLRGHAGLSLLLFERGTAKAHLGPDDFSPAQILRFENHP